MSASLWETTGLTFRPHCVVSQVTVPSADTALTPADRQPRLAPVFHAGLRSDASPIALPPNVPAGVTGDVPTIQLTDDPIGLRWEASQTNALGTVQDPATG